MPIVVLADGITAVAYGGLGEVAGSATKSATISGIPRIEQSMFNQTYVLRHMTDAEASEHGFGRFACGEEQSRQIRSHRVLPDDA